MAGKRILVVTGSPRAEGNCERLAAAFMRGAEAAGHETMKFEAAFKKIEGCRACDTCWSKGAPCSYRDDFDELAPLLEKADIIALITPLYWFTYPAKLKAAIDKIYAYISDNCKRPLRIKGSLLMVCAGDTDPKIFEGIAATYREMAQYLGWESAGVLTAGGLNEKDSIEKTNFLAKAEEYGRTI